MKILFITASLNVLPRNVLFLTCLTFSTFTLAESSSEAVAPGLWERVLSFFGQEETAEPVVVAEEDAHKASHEFYEKALGALSDNDPEAAIIFLKNAIRYDKENLSAYILISETYLEKFDGASAESALKSAIANGIDEKYLAKLLAEAYLQQFKYQEVLDSVNLNGLPKTLRSEVNILKSEALFRLGELEKARNIVETILESDPDNVAGLLQLAKIALDEDLEKAKKSLDSVSKQAKTEADYWFYRSEYFRRKGQNQRAVESLTTALDIEPRSLVFLQSRASLYLDANSLVEAINDIKKIRELHSDDLRGLMLEALYYQKVGQLDKKQDALNQAFSQIEKLNMLMLQDDAYNLMLVSNIYYLGQRFSDAETMLKRYLELKENDLKAYHLLARVQLHKNQPTHAKLTIEKGLDVSNDGMLVMLLAEAEIQLNNYAAATKIYEALAESNPALSNIQQRLALSKLAEGKTQEAIAALKALIQDTPFNTANRILLAKVYLGTGDFNAAIVEGKKILSNAPELAIPHNIIGNAYLGLEDFNNARHYFALSLDKAPEFVPSLFNLATIDVREKKPEEALKKLRKVLEIDPKNALAMNQMAGIYLQLGDLAQEMEWRKKAMEIEVDIDSGLRLVELYFKDSQRFNAEDTLKVLLQKSPNNLRLLAMSAHFSLLDNNGQKAKNTYQKMSRIALETESIRDVLSVFNLQKKAGDLTSAEKTLVKALEIFPNDVALLAARAEIDISRNDYKAALSKAERIVKQAADASTGYKLAGDASMLMSRYEQALDWYRSGLDKAEANESLALAYFKALQQRESNQKAVDFLETWATENDFMTVSVLQALAAGYARTGKTDEAILINEKLLLVQPNNAAVINNLALLYLETGDERAVNFAERAHELMPDSYPILDTLGWVLTKSGQAEKGLPYLRSASARSFNSPDIQYHYAVALSHVGENKKAAQVLKQLLSLGQEFSEQPEAKALYDKIR